MLELSRLTMSDIKSIESCLKSVASDDLKALEYAVYGMQVDE